MAEAETAAAASSDAGYAQIAEAVSSRLRHQRPVLVGIGGGVAAGKTTAARRLRDQLIDLRVAIVATDGFLFPNDVLVARGLIDRKGFPDSYDDEGLVRFVAELRARLPEVRVPRYSHDTYDVVPDQWDVLAEPDVVILEGVNALRIDGIDVRIYIDADEASLVMWYCDRFVRLCSAARGQPGSFYHRFAGMADDAIVELARMVWAGINGVNLHEHILPTRDRADIVVQKGPDHSVIGVRFTEANQYRVKADPPL